MFSTLIYDPTASDSQSSVRGVGRYLQILKEHFEKEWTFSNSLQSIDSSLQTFINPFFNIISPPLLTRRIAKKQIAVIHDLIPLKYPTHFPLGLRGSYNVFLNKLFLKYYDLIVTDSESSKKDIISLLKIPEHKIKVIYPTAPAIFFEKKRNLDFKPPVNKYCLYVGDATWNKNLVNLAKAIKKINVTSVFIGKVFEKKISDLNHPWQAELRQFLIEGEGDKRFIFPGFIEDYKLINYYEQSRLNILLSRDEGFGFSYLESALLGVPSVLSDIPVFKEISADSAFFAHPENVDDIANKIGEIYFNEEARNNWKAKVLYRADFFSREKFKQSWTEIVERA